MKLIYMVTLFCVIFLAGCSDDKVFNSKDKSDAQQVAIDFAQALISQDYSKAYSFTSKQYQTEHSQQQLRNDFVSNFEDAGISSQQFKIDQAKVTSGIAYDESVYFSIPLGRFTNEADEPLDMELVAYVIKEGGHKKISGINFIETEDSSF